MTHGTNNGFIYAHDKPLELSEIWNTFKGHKSLMGKPKLFFVQACRGSNVAKGIEVPNQLVPDLKSKSISIPEFSDNLVMYSTDENTLSLRDEEKGTWFIQELCNQIEHNLTQDLMSILTIVTRKIALMSASIDVNGKVEIAKQLPIIMTSLTKKIYFHDQTVTNDGEKIIYLREIVRTENKFFENIFPIAAFAFCSLMFLIKK